MHFTKFKGNYPFSCKDKGCTALRNRGRGGDGKTDDQGLKIRLGSDGVS